MKLNQHLKDWKQIVSGKFPHLSLPQVSGLATWSFGIVMTHSSSLTKVSTLIAKVNQEKENTVRQRLKDWKELFHSLKNVVPQDYLVIVSADRGLYADWLYKEITALNWHPFLRINHQGQYYSKSSSSWQPLATVVTHENQNWSGKITCFKSNPID